MGLLANKNSYARRIAARRRCKDDGNQSYEFGCPKHRLGTFRTARF
jgi:hypothetical protein